MLGTVLAFYVHEPEFSSQTEMYVLLLLVPFLQVEKERGYVCLFELWFSQGICPVVGLLGHTLTCVK